MHTLQEAHSGPDAMYYGDRPTWLIAATVTRDSNLLEQSNFAVAQRRLAAIGAEGQEYAIESSGHWACGWIDRLVINPQNAAMVAAATGIEQGLQEYPALDDEDYSNRQQEEHDAYHQDYTDRDCTFCEYEREDGTRDENGPIARKEEA